jgi:hypothetical protein
MPRLFDISPIFTEPTYHTELNPNEHATLPNYSNEYYFGGE